MGRAPCCDKANVKRGPWSPEEDAKLKDYIHSNGTGGNWIALPQKAGLKRCGKSCRLRWLNYLRPNIKHGEFSDDEDRVICTLFAAIGSRWSIIAAQLPGRTDNDIKNYWNTKLKKKLMSMSNNINPNPQLMTSLSPLNLPKSPSPDSNNPFLPSPALPSSSFNSGPNYYNAPPSLTGFDQAAAGILVNSPNGYILCPSPPMQENSNNPVFGGAQELRCSSPDGSGNNKDNNSIIHQYDLHNFQDQDQQYHGCLPNSSQNSNPLTLGETAALMGYGLEEIKQLISIDTATSTGYFGESNAGERVMMYYY
ncbi:hypothetical protein V2J09_006618 [Rumex salicifolius]